MMQKLKFIILLTFVAGMLSCSDNHKKDLQKKWKVADVAFVNEQEALVQSDTLGGENMMEHTKEIVRNILLKNIYDFSDGETCVISDGEFKTTFNYELKKGLIRFTSAEDKTGKLIDVASLSNDTLILVLRNDQSSLQSKLTLIPLK